MVMNDGVINTSGTKAAGETVLLDRRERLRAPQCRATKDALKGAAFASQG